MSSNGHRKMSLTERQKKLNEMIKCPAGRGQVYLRSLIDPKHRKDGPEIALRCKIREYLGYKNCLLGLEEIVITCCKDPMKTCEAYQRFRERSAAG